MINVGVEVTHRRKEEGAASQSGERNWGGTGNAAQPVGGWRPGPAPTPASLPLVSHQHLCFSFFPGEATG